MTFTTCPISRCHCPISRVYSSVRSSLLSVGLIVAGISIGMIRLMFLSPSVVDLTASASPTASVASPASAPLLPDVEKRNHGTVLLSRPHVERWPLCLRRASTRNRLVSPHDREAVIRCDPRYE